MYPSSVCLFFFLLLLVNGTCIPTEAEDFELSSRASNSAVPVSKQIASLSIEFCYITDYLGDMNTPNKLSLRLLQNIQDLTGQPPVIRVGGHTQDVAQYCTSCGPTLTALYSNENTEAYSVKFNRNLFSVLNNNVPSKQQFIFGINLGQDNVSYPLAEVQAAEKYLHSSRLLSYELGNEPDFYGSSQRSPWNVQIYASQMDSWINEIISKTNTKHGWQVAAFAQEPIYQGNFSLSELNTLGVPKAIKTLKSYSDHTYPYSVCDSTRAAQVSLPNLMNHSATISYFSQWSASIAAAHSEGIAFNMGETGSVSCHGKAGVSNTMGAALWELDYVLHGAVLGMQGVYFHMGSPFYYSAWRAVNYPGIGGPQVYPTYYTMLITASALSTLPDPYISALPSPTGLPDVAIYALYPSVPTNTSTPTKLIILNLSFHAANSGTRHSVQVSVSGIMGTKAVQVTRFTAPGADSVTQATFGGQDWLSSGTGAPLGKRVVESVSDGIVVVGDSEGVVVEL